LIVIEIAAQAGLLLAAIDHCIGDHQPQASTAIDVFHSAIQSPVIALADPPAIVSDFLYIRALIDRMDGSALLASTTAIEVVFLQIWPLEIVQMRLGLVVRSPDSSAVLLFQSGHLRLLLLIIRNDPADHLPSAVPAIDHSGLFIIVFAFSRINRAFRQIRNLRYLAECRQNQHRNYHYKEQSFHWFPCSLQIYLSMLLPGQGLSSALFENPAKRD